MTVRNNKISTHNRVQITIYMFNSTLLRFGRKLNIMLLASAQKNLHDSIQHVTPDKNVNNYLVTLWE